ncbi:cobalamin biosynthesis protein [Clostridium botulinum]|uniref:Cobalamin biosynthesis protein CobD n=1 Tax=Clostridium botulinum TaxID=1491 RepID=A0AAU8YWQ5_CLOBO|nr:adenosylcobinamide-phosphate synthase CbiB [Clostridium sporogenes]AVP64530.1 cobalamin biosynthesis protein [Clostridium botulinum]MCF4016048.1 adenosylcobinamide-phosphate synthase CbiB [Clostridium sporogenes]MCW6088546.1 adenosylcobinamide-phosphate synthase CbiB [Clostridium sporogenes]MCW6088697.1 adenosylcobinamide-phosphate synthase CbiB [Clostridium sporogenes]
MYLNVTANFVDIIIAVFIDWIIGDPYWFPHPIIYIGKLISFLEKKFRAKVKNEENLKLYGEVIVMIVCFTSFLIPFIILQAFKFNFYIYHGLNILIIWTTLAAKCLHEEAIKIYHALYKENIEDARLKLSYIVGRETKDLIENEIIRADVETVAENASDGIIAPLFYAMIGGAPLAMMYKGINTMDSMLGYLNDEYKYIGFFPAKVDDVFNFVPARLTGILMCISAPIVGGNPFKSFKIMIRDRKNHKSPNCAYPEGATAAALKIQLGGTNVYFGQVVEKPTIGDKIKELAPIHIKESIKLMYASEGLMIVMCAIIFKFLLEI